MNNVHLFFLNFLHYFIIVNKNTPVFLNHLQIHVHIQTLQTKN